MQEKMVLAILLLALMLWILPSIIRSFVSSDSFNTEEITIPTLLLNAFAKNIP